MIHLLPSSFAKKPPLRSRLLLFARRLPLFEPTERSPLGQRALVGIGGLLCLLGTGCEHLLREVVTEEQSLRTTPVDAGSDHPNDAPAVVPAPLGCSLGEVRCDGPLLQECEGTFGGLSRQWRLLDQCRSGSSCSTTAKQCTARACEVGTWQCSEGRLQVCLGREDWTERDQCDTQMACLSGLQRCGANGECNAANPPACPRSDCTPGQFFCFGDGFLSQCSPQQRWQEVAQCASSALCFSARETGVCAEPVCEFGQARCVDNTLEVCANDQTTFQVVNPPCRSDETCDAEQQACLPPTCEPLSFECDGQSLRRCGALGNSLSTTEVCQSADLCNAPLGRCDLPPLPLTPDAGSLQRLDAGPAD